MESFFTSGRVADLIAGVILLEAVLLGAWLRRRGLAAGAAVLSLAAGLFLVLALRCALTGLPWPWTAACLAAAGLAHGLDTWHRWLRRAG